MHGLKRRDWLSDKRRNGVGVISLKVFMETCQEDGIEPFKILHLSNADGVRDTIYFR